MRLGSRFAGIPLHIMSIYGIAPARKKLLFNVQWDLGADWLVLSKTETGEPLPPLHVCIVHPFNVQFQIALAIIFAKRPADCTLNSTVWLNQNWHIVQCAVLDGAKMSSESASPKVFTSGLRLTPTPREWEWIPCNAIVQDNGGGRIGTFVEYLVLINLTLNKRNNNNGKNSIKRFLAGGLRRRKLL